MEKRDKRIILSVIIVNWNTREFLYNVLYSLKKFPSQFHYEIIVVDNASTDNSPQMVMQEFPDVKLIIEPSNLGFARAVNDGMKNSDASFYLLLNSDCELMSPIIGPLITTMLEKRELGVLGTLLLYPDGSLQSAGEPELSSWSIFKNQVLFAKSPICMRYKQKPECCYQEVGFISGACMLIRGELVQKIGKFREDFFMYGEDVDFCYRARKAGWQVGVRTDLGIIHHKAKSTEQNLNMVLENSVVNNCKLIYEYQSRFQSMISFFYYVLGITIRTVYAFVTARPNAKKWLQLWIFLPGLFKKILR